MEVEQTITFNINEAFQIIKDRCNSFTGISISERGRLTISKRIQKKLDILSLDYNFFEVHADPDYKNSLIKKSQINFAIKFEKCLSKHSFKLTRSKTNTLIINFYTVLNILLKEDYKLNCERCFIKESVKNLIEDGVLYITLTPNLREK